jgi:hypothetical protein
MDLLLGVLAGTAVFVVYLGTIYPGLPPDGNAAKLAFVGKVLGTPHAPGYPLWVMVSHVVSYVPWGSLAYRVNLLSAVFGAATVTLVYLLARWMAVSPLAAGSVALALGFGQTFWAAALHAQTSTFSAALVAAGLLAVLRWSQRRSMADLYCAAAVFSLSLGNHLTVVALAPALTLFALATDRQATLRARTVLTVAMLALLGLCQYGFVLVRTLQGAPYLETRASNLDELLVVMTSGQSASGVGTYASSAVAERTPPVLGVIGNEFGFFGLMLLVAGFAILFRHNRRALLLFGLSACGIAVANGSMGSRADRGFLLSVFVPLWVVAGLGLHWLIDELRRTPLRFMQVLVACLAAFLPAVQVANNFRINDHHRETFETEYLDALFASLPEKTAFVTDDYDRSMLLLYKILGEDAAGARDVRLVPAERNGIEKWRRDGFEILAFRSGRDILTQSGLSFTPFRGADPKTGEMLRRREVFRIVSTPVCAEVGNMEWRDVSDVAQPKGRLTVQVEHGRPFDARLVLYAAGDAFVSPAFVGARGSDVRPFAIETFPREESQALALLSERVRADGIELPDSLRGARVILRAEARVNDAAGSFAVDLGRGARTVAARTFGDRDQPGHVTVCAHPLADTDAWPPNSPRATFGPDSSVVQFDDGWHTVERLPDGFTWRWTSDRAVLVMPLDYPRSLTLTIDAWPFGHPRWREGSTSLIVNGHRLDTRPLALPRATYAWSVSDAHLREGLNELVFEVTGGARPIGVGFSADPRLLGISVSGIELREANEVAP